MLVEIRPTHSHARHRTVSARKDAGRRRNKRPHGASPRRWARYCLSADKAAFPRVWGPCACNPGPLVLLPR